MQPPDVPPQVVRAGEGEGALGALVLRRFLDPSGDRGCLGYLIVVTHESGLSPQHLLELVLGATEGLVHHVDLFMSHLVLLRDLNVHDA